MAEQHIEALLKDLQRQGCRIRRTPAGAFIYCPDGKNTLGIHTSKAGDRRTWRNIRASVRRVNLEWPKGLPG